MNPSELNAAARRLSKSILREFGGQYQLHATATPFSVPPVEAFTLASLKAAVAKLPPYTPPPDFTVELDRQMLEFRLPEAAQKLKWPYPRRSLVVSHELMERLQSDPKLSAFQAGHQHLFPRETFCGVPMVAELESVRRDLVAKLTAAVFTSTTG